MVKQTYQGNADLLWLVFLTKSVHEYQKQFGLFTSNPPQISTKPLFCYHRAELKKLALFVSIDNFLIISKRNSLP